MLELALHSSETRRPRHKVRASARRIAGSELLTLRFEIEGAAHIVWPHGEQKVRRDGLWKQTCLECFIGGATSAYNEWNFSPDGDWAAYHFDSYREGMKKADVAAPSIVRTSVSDRARFEIDFEVPEESLAGAKWAMLALSITAVIIEKDEHGQPTAPFYWALAHNGTKPDFHLRESFTLEVEC